VTLLPALLALATACGGGGSGEVADAAPPDGALEQFGCATIGSDGGDPFDMAVSVTTEDGSFTPLGDGDDATLVLGFQGFYMLRLDSHAMASITADKVCFDCSEAVSASSTTSFAGAMAEDTITWDALGDGPFGTTLTLILGSSTTPELYDGAEVDYDLTCYGHGFTGTLHRALRLVVPP
jgi:hypothetical protein